MSNFLKKSVNILIFLLCSFNFLSLNIIFGQSQSAVEKADQILGVYYVVGPNSSGEIKVQIYKTNTGTYSAKVVWSKEPNNPDGTPKMDVKNPDPKLRNVRCDQMMIFYDIKYDAKNDEWSGGKIYNPLDGNSYSLLLQFESPTQLKLRGYLGIPLFGKNMYWTKMPVEVAKN
jgi:uncharacterized protein (DUF2147 family)